MTFEEKLERYARLAVETGCNLKPGQELFVSADVSQVALVRLVTKIAYERGASDVTVRFTDEQVSRLGFDYKPAESFKQFPAWQAEL